MPTSNTSSSELPPATAVQTGLYRHYKGGWYEVLDTVRCSETLQSMTLYRALYGSFGLWVRPASMFLERGVFQGQQQARFTRHDPSSVGVTDLAGATALVAHLQSCAQSRGIDLNTTLRAAPPAPISCCGRGCDGCVWTGYFAALRQWRDDACALLSHPLNPRETCSGGLTADQGRPE